MRTRPISAALTPAALAALAAGGLAACSDSTNPLGTTSYVSAMTDAEEVPPTGTAATGRATYMLTGRTITYTITVEGLSGPAVAAHIHVGAKGVNGPIVLPFSPASVASGQLASGTIDLDQPIVFGSSSITGDSLLVLMNNGNAYTNVHTAAHPGGEIRGQIVKR
ncbi:MAG TPA: CHRD domain-containing protein [Longimicrobiales bacterium]|nr:CHRD domain-containing protein [Longimicrobiales bacterium]